MRTFPLAALAGAALLLAACGTQTTSAPGDGDRRCPSASPLPPGAAGLSEGGVRITSFAGAAAAGGDCPASEAAATYEVTNDSGTPMTYTVALGFRSASGGAVDVVTQTVAGVRPGQTVRRTVRPSRLPSAAPVVTGAEISKVRSVPAAEAPAQGGPCPRSGVRVYADQGDAAMGLRVVGLHLENCGTRVYRLDGYPELHLLDEEHRPVTGVRVQRGGDGISSGTGADATPVPLALKPGEAARATLTWRNTTGFGDPVNAPYVRVHARPGADPVTVTPELDLGTTGRLGVGAWQRTDAGTP
ncbi:DUF4232 domain-containing protein [Streptomyces griseosporeus]|uniref:DUF4232 domain-containing protein n=1 Tax=Streptomyces griseosporeus TaxID=1910 RepID=UPI0036FC6AD6